MSMMRIIWCPKCDGFIAQLGFGRLSFSYAGRRAPRRVRKNIKWLKEAFARESEKERTCGHCGFVGKIKMV